MLDRLLGLETEYAIRFTPAPGSPAADNDVIYDAVRSAVDSLVLTRRGDGAREQYFVENGGAIAYEFLPAAPDGGLVEGATPECRGPAEGVLYQRAQDALLAAALPIAERRLAEQGRRGSLGLLKNCRDAEGHVYGVQENYETELARGPALWLWRAGLAALLPVIAVCALASWLTILVFLSLWLLAVILAGLAALVIPRLRRSDVLSEILMSSPSRRFERTLGRIEYVLHGHVLWAPVLWPFLALVRLTAFRAVRRDALAFLLSRPILTGAGSLDAGGGFGLSEKGPAMRRLVRLWVGQHDRAVFDGGNLCKPLLRMSYLDLRRFFLLFRRRQRMQLGLADANMAQVAEYLKIGTTALVIDMVEAGALDGLPRLRHPLAALRAIIADPSLQVRVEVEAGAPVRAIDIQRAYLERAREFVARSPVTSIEAADLLGLWGRMLDALEALATRGVAARGELVGQLDWVTKQYLLDAAGAGASPAARKKIDLKYHELGSGYFARLEREHLAPTLWSTAEIERARREPPTSSSARARSRVIRNLGRRETAVKVSWDRIRLGRPIGGTVIRLDAYRDT
jgi:proteasome accessory factor A